MTIFLVNNHCDKFIFLRIEVFGLEIIVLLQCLKEYLLFHFLLE